MNNIPFYPFSPYARPYFPRRNPYSAPPLPPDFPKEEELPPEEPQAMPEEPIFEILGIRLFYDDILLICLIFFLYSEGIQDTYLFLALVLLLLS